MTQDNHTPSPGVELADADHALRQRARTPQKGKAATTERDYSKRSAQNRRAATFSASVAVVAAVVSFAAKPAVLAVSAAVGVLVFAPATVDRAATQVYGAMPEPVVVSRIVENSNCAEYGTILDEDHEVLGFLPKIGHCGSRAHASLPISDATIQRHADFIETVEGPFDGPGVVLNVSAKGMARALYYAAFGSNSIGGTIPILSAIEFVAGQSNGLDLVDKSKFVAFWGPSFIAHHLPTIDDRKQFASEHLPCARPMPGTDAKILVFSGSFCGLLVGSAPSLDNLSDAQHCLIVAAYKHQLPIVGPTGSAEDHDEMAKAFEALRVRADRTCLSRRLTGRELTAARATLAAIPVPNAEGVINKFASLTTNARGTATLIRDARARQPNPDVSDGPTRVTIDQTANAKMSQTLRNGVRREVSTRLSPELCWGAPCPGSDQAHVGLAIATLTDEGRLEFDAAYQSRSGLLLPRSSSMRNTASTSKAMLLPFLIEHGVDQVCIDRQNWPNRLPPPEQSARCTEDNLSITLEDAVAVSNNAAFLRALAHPNINEGELKAYLRLLGYEIQTDLSGKDLHVGIVFGWGISIGPDELMRNFAFLAANRPVTLPQLFEGTADPRFTFGAFVGGQALARARAMLEAPLRKRHGTLYGLADALDHAGCGTGAIGKSGTADASNKLARDRLTIGAFTCKDGTTRVFFSLFGSPRETQELGRDITSKTTKRVVGSALRAYVEEIVK
ncbi:MAG: hypothetical protein AB8B47_13240 [Roseobacter sp.]